MTKIITSWVAAACLLWPLMAHAAPFSCQPLQPVAGAPRIAFTIGFNKTDTRFQYVDCVLNRAMHRLGYRAELLAAPVGRELFDVAEGRADAIAATTIESMWPIQIDTLIRLESPFVQVANIVITRRDVPTPQTWQALAASGLQIVMARHHRSAQAYLANANTLDVEGVDQAVQVFLAGRAEALVTFEANEEIRMLPELSGADFNPAQVLSVSPLYTYIDKRFAGQAEAMNAAIQAEVTTHLWNLHD